VSEVVLLHFGRRECQVRHLVGLAVCLVPEEVVLAEIEFESLDQLMHVFLLRAVVRPFENSLFLVDEPVVLV